jgi:ACT domain-containing protein
MYALLKNQQLPCEGDTLAEGIAVKIPGSFTSEVIRGLVDDIVLVSEAQLETAVSLLLQIEKTVVEGAGAAGLAAVMANPEIFAGKNVGVVLCGGNIDTRLLANVLLRDLARSGRLARLRLTLQDRPGALYKVMRLFNEHNVNIIEIYHQRIFTTLPAKGLITDIECEARDAEQLQGLVDGLNAAGRTTGDFFKDLGENTVKIGENTVKTIADLPSNTVKTITSLSPLDLSPLDTEPPQPTRTGAVKATEVPEKATAGDAEKDAAPAAAACSYFYGDPSGQVQGPFPTATLAYSDV